MRNAIRSCRACGGDSHLPKPHLLTVVGAGSCDRQRVVAPVRHYTRDIEISIIHKKNRSLHSTMTAIFSVLLLSLVTSTAAANGTTTMPEGVPTIEVNDAWRVRRDALWQCRMCATKSVVFLYIHTPESIQFKILHSHVGCYRIFYSVLLTPTDNNSSHIRHAHTHTRTH